jgi:hypothetical protein
MDFLDSVSSVSSDGGKEDIEELDVLTDDIEMPILDENDPDLAVFEDF